MNNIQGVYKTIGGVFNRFIPRKEDKTKGRYSYGVKDNLPQEIIELIGGNPTAIRCVLKIAEYITARGFANEKLNDIEVTKGKTARKLLMETAIQYAFFECVCWHVARKISGEVGSVDIHPFEMVRRMTGGGLAYNKTIMSGQEKNEWEVYPAFPAEVTKGYKGEILYEWNKTPVAFNHPVPAWFAGEYTIRTGTELCLSDLELVENGFMPSAILKIVAKFDNTVKDPVSGKTQQELFEEHLKKWTSKSKDSATGKSMRHSIMVMAAESKEQFPELETVDVEGVITGSIEKKESVDKDTCRVFNVNPILLHWDSDSMFSSGEFIKNLKSNMAESVLDAQNKIKECFEKVFPNEKWDLTTLDPYKSIVEKTEDQKILDTINSLSPLLGAEVVRNMPKEILLRLVGVKPEDMKETQPENVNQ